jgi:uroporphyrin-III C-methyltransferase/precorrin-2 dehydrogenase/sirohydrochlorin ferrochelatase
METNPSKKVLVSLIGAAPADSELWTVRAIKRLARADLVLHDSTVALREVRRFTRGKCRSVDDRGHDLMVRAAQEGKRVVRLYGGPGSEVGDRSEDALALQAAGVPFEIVPGISSALAPAELAGIPITHRGVASGFIVLSSPSAETLRNALQRERPKNISLVVSIDLSRRGWLATDLIERGWSGTTPAAVVYEASIPDQPVWTGSLAQLRNAEASPGMSGVVVIGEVVQVRDVLARSFTGTTSSEVQYGRN